MNTPTVAALVLMVFGFVCETLAAFNVAAKFNLMAAGLAFWLAAEIFYGVGKVYH